MLATFSVTNLNDAGTDSLREAITMANGNGEADTITFSVAGTINLASQLPTISEAVTIDGGKQITLDAGDGTDGVFNTGDGFRIFNINDGVFLNQIDVTLSGLTLTGGDATNNFNSDGTSGGAIYSLENLMLVDSTVAMNAAGDGGDGEDGSGFGSGEDGFSGGSGGGIFSLGTLTLTSSTISGNRSGDGGDGGEGISGDGDGGRGGDGGGIYSRGLLTLIDSTVAENRTGRGGDDGGASSEANGGKGGGIFRDSNVLLNGSTISGNETLFTRADGGGIYARGDINLSLSTISGNETSGSFADGGGVFSFAAVTLSQSTVANNEASSASAYGGGIWNGNGTITISNSIVASNAAGGGGADIQPGTGALNVDYSLIEQTGLPLAGTGTIVGVAANLGPLADNLGSTETHALLAGSPAIDAGDPGIVFDANEFDQRGTPFVRVFDDLVASGTGIDMGAYERQTVTSIPFVVDTNVDESNGDLTAGDRSLRELIMLANISEGAETITFSPSLAGETIQLGSELFITDAVTIVGGGEITLDAGDGADGIFNTGDGYRIFNINDGTTTLIDVTLSGITLTGGDTTDGSAGFSGDAGGAILSVENLAVIDSTVTRNATGDGGSGTGTFGGGGQDGGKGGGIFSSGVLTVTNSTVSGNTTGIGGSGTGTQSGNDGDGGRGAGIYSFGTLVVTGSTISGNSTSDQFAHGAGIFAREGATISLSTISGNETTGGSSDGGGLFSYGAIVLSRSTVTDNRVISPFSKGGGIWNNNDTITITNSIVASNTAGGSDPDVRPGTGALNVDYSLIQQTGLAISGTGTIVGMAANLGPLANNAGPTQTHALLTGSPAIDSGDPGIAFYVNEFDQRGAPFVRVVDGGSNGQRIDMGAYELQPLPAAFGVVDTAVDEFDGDYSTGDLSLREAIDLANNFPGLNTITFDPALAGSNIMLDSQLLITDSLTITGENQITLDAGDGTDGVFGTGDGHRIFNVDNGMPSFIDVSISGLTLTGGDTADGLDAGIGNDGGAGSDGGAIRSLENLTIESLIATGNATGSGGNGQSSGFSNPGNGGDGGRGGSIFSAAGALTIVDSTISNNKTGDGGSGDSFAVGGDGGDGGTGGGVYVSGPLTVVRSTIANNSTGSGGVGASPPFVGGDGGNGGSGGGIYHVGNELLISQSTISNNSTAVGGAGGTGNTTNGVAGVGGTGAGFQSNGNIQLSGSTVTANLASGSGGGISNDGSAIVVSNSIVSDNSAGSGNNDIDPGTGAFSVNFSLIGTGVTPDSGTSGNNVVADDPMLGPLADNGGPTETHALLAGSPAIDAGDGALAVDASGNPLLTDQRGAGFDRIFGDTVDIGAYEFGSSTFLLGDVNQDGVINFSDIPSFITVLQSGVYLDEADINGDGIVDFSDIPFFIELLIAQ